MCLGLIAGGAGCGLLDTRPEPVAPRLLPGQSGGVFTTGHATFAGAMNDFLARRPEAVQPIEFPHNIHVQQQIGCTEYCHEGATKGPVAGLPSVNTCMICHAAIATDKPRIQQITALQAKGEDLNWQRVFGYPPQQHVRFNHEPHIRAKVECSTCHGNIAEQTVAQPNVHLSMGACVTCHNERKAPVDCMTCHF